LLPRWNWEKHNRRVELCLDGREVLALAQNDSAAAFRMLSGFREAGISSLAVFWQPGEDAPLSSPFLTPPEDISVVLRPEPEGFVPFSPGGPPGLRGRVSSLLFAGNAVWGYPALSPVKEWIGSTDWRLPWIEFTRQLGAAELVRAFPDRLVRGHSLDEEEMARARPADVEARFLRAVRERGIRFLYIRLFPGLSPEANQAYVTSLGNRLENAGFRLESAEAQYLSWRPFWDGLPSRARQALAFLASVLLPPLFLRWALRRPHAILSPLAVTACTVGTALFVAALLSTPDFVLGLERFRGVKAALALPLLIAFAQLYSRRELAEFSRRTLTLGTAAVFLGAAAVLGLYLLRSGHDTFLGVSGGERHVRETLETILGVRPRFKEFLIGHPLLWAGFYALTRRGFPVRDPRPLVWAGFVGQLSIVNTFCHAHTPLTVSLVRTIHGIWIGALLGGLLIATGRLIERWMGRDRHPSLAPERL
jgi:hypothetical protein